MIQHERSRPHRRHWAALAALGAIAGLQSAAVAQGEEEPARVETIRLRAAPESELLVLEALTSDGESIRLATTLIELASIGSETITATLQADASGEFHLCPPEPEQPRVMIGVTTEPLTEALAAQLRLGQADAVLVAEVTEGMPAQEAGVRRYDVITAVDGEHPVTQDSLRARVERCSSGDTIHLSLVREGHPEDCIVVVRPYEETADGSPMERQVWAWVNTPRMFQERTLELLVEPRIGEYLVVTPTIEARPHVQYEWVLGAEGTDESPQARLRAELSALREKIDAIEAILDELEVESR